MPWSLKVNVDFSIFLTVKLKWMEVLQKKLREHCKSIIIIKIKGSKIKNNVLNTNMTLAYIMK